MTVRPSQDLAAIAWRCDRGDRGRSLDGVPSPLNGAVLRGVPEEEADLVSYLHFERRFSRELLEVGRADAHAARDAILALPGDAERSGAGWPGGSA